MKIMRPATAGTLESNDVFVIIEPKNGVGIEVELESIVMAQFGDDIIASVCGMLNEMGINEAHIELNDHGALDCVIRARVETAVLRASEVGA